MLKLAQAGYKPPVMVKVAGPVACTALETVITVGLAVCTVVARQTTPDSVAYTVLEMRTAFQADYKFPVNPTKQGPAVCTALETAITVDSAVCTVVARQTTPGLAVCTVRVKRIKLQADYKFPENPTKQDLAVCTVRVNH